MRRAVLSVFVLTVSGSCALPDPSGDPSVSRETVVYGADDREEVFLGEDELRRIAGELLAIGAADEVAVPGGGPAEILSPSWEERAGLCAGERFGDQPVVASAPIRDRVARCLEFR